MGTKDTPQKKPLFLTVSLAAVIGFGTMNWKELDSLKTELSIQKAVISVQQGELAKQTRLTNHQKKEKEKITQQYQETVRSFDVEKKQYETKLQQKEKQIEALQSQKNQVLPTSSSISVIGNYREISVEASGYTATCTGCTGITATGINLWTHPNEKIVAVDPSVVPLGSKVYVEGYGYATAADTGGAIKGDKIDLLFPSVAEAFRWGRKRVRMRIYR